MDSAQADALRELLASQRIASLGTLHDDEPQVSMVPFALLPGGAGFVIHVSQLAAHTKDMLANPRVSLLVIAPPSPGISVQAMARVTIQGQATQSLSSAALHAEAKQAYLSRFPEGAPMFDFSDFSLFVIEPRSIRFIGGFAQARTLAPAELAEALGKP